MHAQHNGYDTIRIYRSSNGAAAPYLLAAEIPATDTTYLDERRPRRA